MLVVAAKAQIANFHNAVSGYKQILGLDVQLQQHDTERENTWLHAAGCRACPTSSSQRQTGHPTHVTGNHVWTYVNYAGGVHLTQAL